MRKGLELIVDEPVADNFYWVILGREMFGEPRRTLDRASRAYPTHRAAIEAGVVAMRRHFEPSPVASMSALSANSSVTSMRALAG